jgi:hypothetical protein
MTWISDMTNKEIGEEIERLCKLGDLQVPELPKETAEFIRDEFGRYDTTIVRLAFDRWVSGNIKVQAYAKANANFLCKVLRAYVEEFRHKLVKKPKQYINTEEPRMAILTPEEIRDGDFQSIQRCKEQWVKVVLSNEKGFISYTTLMHTYELLKKYELLPLEVRDSQIDEMVKYYKNYRHKSDMESLRGATNEVKRASIQKIIQRAQEHHIDWYKIGLVGYYFAHNK